MSEKETFDAPELPEQLTLTLRKPITLKDQTTIDALELREPNAGEFKKFAKQTETDPAAALVQLVANVSGVPLPLIDRVSVRDLNAARDYLLGFMVPSLPAQTN